MLQKAHLVCECVYNIYSHEKESEKEIQRYGGTAGYYTDVQTTKYTPTICGFCGSPYN